VASGIVGFLHVWESGP